MEKQMSIYDYLNNDKLAVMDTTSAIDVTETVEKIEAEPVDYNTLSKAELITVLADKDNVINNYIDKIEHMEKEHKTEIENLNTYYSKRNTELSNLVMYYERKIKVIKDIITLETGGEK